MYQKLTQKNNFFFIFYINKVEESIMIIVLFCGFCGAAEVYIYDYNNNRQLNP